MLRTVWPVGLILAASLTACTTEIGDHSNPYDPDSVNPVPATIAGSVVAPGRTLQPGRAQNQDILVQLSRAGTVVTEARTDDEGLFLLIDLDPGRYSLIISEVGFQTFQLFDLRTEIDDALELGVITLVSTASTEDAPVVDGIASLEGLGAGEHGGIQVRAIGTPFVTLTAPDGSFQLVLSDGTFDLEFTYPDYQTHTIAGITLALGELHTLPAEVMLLSNPGQVDGLVMVRSCTTDPASSVESPADGAAASLRGTALTALSAPDGTFGITGVPAGLYTLQIIHAGWNRQEVPAIEVRGGKATTLTEPIVLEPSRGALAGNVFLTGESDHSGVLVQLAGTGFFTLSGTDGSWRIDGVCAGSGYEVVASRDKFVTFSSGGITVTPGATFSVPDLNLERQQGGLNLNGGKNYTRLVDVSYLLDAAAGTTHMRLSEDLGIFATGTTPGDPEAGTDGWVAYTNTGSFALTTPDGITTFEGARTVYAQVYGNTAFSGVLQDEVILDQVAPQNPSIEIEDGTGYSNDPDGALLTTLIASEVAGPSVDQVSGLGEIKLINTDPVTCGSSPCPTPTQADWDAVSAIPYNRFVDHFVANPALDDEKEVWALFSDRADNWSLPVWTRVVLDREAPDTISIAINNGLAFARTDRVSLALSALDENLGLQMRLSNESTFLGSIWRPFSPSVTWFLDAQNDGLKEVWVQFMDAAGNTSQALSDDITLDRAFPTAVRFEVLQGAYARLLTVDLDIAATDATEMIIADNPSFLDGAGLPLSWQPFATAATFVLDNTERLHTLYVQFRDVADNRSEVLTALVTLDLVAPTISDLGLTGGVFEVATGWIHVPQNSVTLLTTAIPGPLDAHEMRIDLVELDGAGTETSRATGNWSAFAPSRVVALTLPGGHKVIEVLLRDAAGNPSATASLDVIFDPDPPIVSGVTLDGGAAFTGQPQVALGITVGDPTDANAMQLSNRADFAGALWQPFAASVDWVLPSIDQLHTVRVRVRDLAGNVGSSAGSIELDRAGPVGLSVTVDGGQTYSTDLDIPVVLAASDSGAGMASVELSNDSGFTTSTLISWLPAGAASVTRASWGLAAVDGSATIHARFRDTVGNLSLATGTIIVDRSPPTGTISIDDGASHATGIAVSLYLTAPADTTLVSLANSPIGSCATPPNTYEAFAATKPWTLDPIGDGSKTVTVCFQDAAGNTAQSSDTITLDRANPAGTFTLAGGVTAVNDKVTPFLLTGLSADVVEMAMAEGAIDCSAAIYGGLVPNGSFSVSEPDGPKTVLVCLRDAAGRTVQLSDAVTLDRLPPTGSLILNTSDVWTTTDQVQVTGTGVGAAEYALANESIDCTSLAPAAWSPVVAGSFSRACPGSCWGLLPADGLRSVKACLRDTAGNTAIVEDNINLDSTPPAGTISIDDGASHATGTAVSLFLTAPADTTLVSMANGPIASCATPPNAYSVFSATKPWTLDAVGDGSKTVTVCFQDAAGNQAQSSDTITLDRANPTGTFTLAGGVSSVNDKVTPFLLTGLSSDVVEMAMAEGAIDCSAAIYGGLIPNGSFSVSEPDGPKTVLVCLRDAAGRTLQLSDAVTLDRLPPTGTLSLNTGNLWTSSEQVQVDGTGVGATEYALANESIDCISIDAGSWVSVAGGVFSRACPGNCWGLLPADGLRSVKACLRDAAGNTAIVEDDISLDTTPPTAAVGIDGDADYTTSTSVTLSLSSSADVTTMRIANGNDCLAGAPQGFAPSLPFTLTNTQGLRRVSACFYDAAGNSSPAFDTITLDSQPPTGTLSIDGGDPSSTSKDVSLDLASTADVVSMAVVDGNSLDCATATYGTFLNVLPWRLPEGDGLKSVAACYLDAAGNTALATDDILLDTTPPAIPGLFRAGISEQAIDLAWTVPGDPDLAGFILERRLAHEGSFTALPAFGPTDSSHSDPVDPTDLGVARFYRILAFDSRGNDSPYSIELAVGTPIAPPEATYLNGVDRAAIWTYPKGTTLALSSYDYEDLSRTLSSLSLPPNATRHPLVASTGRYNERITVRTNNGDSSLVWESEFVFGNLRLRVNEENVAAYAPRIAVDSLGTPHMVWRASASVLPHFAYLRRDGTGPTITFGHNSTPAGQAAIAVDSNDLAHVVYTPGDAGGTIYHLPMDGVSTPTTLLTTGSNQHYLSLAFDSTDTGHLAYYDGTQDALGYLKMDGVSTPQILDSGSKGRWLELAVDATDTPHIVYEDNSTVRRPAYLRHDGISTPQLLASDGGIPSIAIDSTNVAHVLYLDTSSSPYTLYYLPVDGVSTPTAIHGQSGRQNSITMDARDVPHIAYFDALTDDAVYLRHDGVSAAQPLDVVGDTGWDISIAVEQGGTPHFIFQDYTNKDIIYVQLDSPPIIEQVDGSNNGGDTGLVLDSQDLPHVLYSHRSPWELRYRVMDGSSPVQVLDSGSDVGWGAALAMGSDDIPHASYLDQTTANLKYLRIDGVSTPQVVDASGDLHDHTAIAVDSGNVPHVVYSLNAAWDLKFLRIDGVAVPQIINDNTPVNAYPSLVFDTADVAHVVNRRFASGFYWENSAGWNSQTFGAGHSVTDPSIALDPSGQPHVAFFCSDTQALCFANLDGVNDTDVLDSSGFMSTALSHVIDGAGVSHIAYHDIGIGVLRYLKADGKSEPQIIDDGSNAGKWASIQVARDGRVFISYEHGFSSGVRLVSGRFAQTLFPVREEQL